MPTQPTSFGDLLDSQSEFIESLKRQISALKSANAILEERGAAQAELIAALQERRAMDSERAAIGLLATSVGRTATRARGLAPRKAVQLVPDSGLARLRADILAENYRHVGQLSEFVSKELRRSPIDPVRRQWLEQLRLNCALRWNGNQRNLRNNDLEKLLPPITNIG